MYQLLAISRILLGLCCFFGGITNSEAIVGRIWNDTWTDRLRQDLLATYDKFARPTQHYNTTKVRCALEPYHVSINDFQSAMNVMGYTRTQWKDEKLKWNASKYGGIRHLQVGSHEIWQPDIIVDNSLGTSANLQESGTLCFVVEDGTVACEAQLKLNVLCNLDHHHWPFDIQKCKISIFSWFHGGYQNDLQFLHLKDLGDSEELIQNSEWELREMSKLRDDWMNPCCKHPFITLHYNLVLKRNSTVQKRVIVTPTVFIVFLSLVNFWLPPHCKKKMILCALLALLISLFLAYLGEKIPSSSSRPPLIVSFYSGCLYQTTISLVISAIVISLSRRQNYRAPPRVLQKILLGRTGRYLGLSDHIHRLKYQRSNGEEDPRESHGSDSFPSAINSISNDSRNRDDGNGISSVSNTVRLEWIFAATAIDRISFFIFCNVFALMSIIYIP